MGSKGIDLSGRFNITIKNTEIKTFHYGIWLEGSHNNTISGNSIAANQWESIFIVDSSNNTISENCLTTSSYSGMFVSWSPNNIISRNNITANSEYGIYFYGADSTNNVISENTITDNSIGLCFTNYAANNLVYHNNFANRFLNAYPSSVNFWDDAYPSGGNYWSDYAGLDLYSGPYQNETGSDGIGDTPYVIDENNQDNYPLMKLYPWGPHDIGITNMVASKTIVGKGFSMHINITIFNYGNNTETFNLTIYSNTSISSSLNDIVLTSRNSTTITFTWDTTGFAKGNYTIWAYAWPIENETDIIDNALIFGTLQITKKGDVNGDGDVNVLDLILVAVHLGHPRPPIGIHPPLSKEWYQCMNTDINDDGDHNVLDLILVAIYLE